MDFDGGSSKVFSAEVVVADMTPGFEVDTLEFAFDNGKYYRVIAKNSPGPDYRLRVKARGRGVLTGQFMLDNMPIGLFQLVVQENQAAALPKAQMPALPVMDLGLHELTVKFGNYSFNKQDPHHQVFRVGWPARSRSSPRSSTPGSRLGKPSNCAGRSSGKSRASRSRSPSIPFQFMDDKQIVWRPVGEASSFQFAPGDAPARELDLLAGAPAERKRPGADHLRGRFFQAERVNGAEPLPPAGRRRRRDLSKPARFAIKRSWKT